GSDLRALRSLTVAALIFGFTPDHGSRYDPVPMATRTDSPGTEATEPAWLAAGRIPSLDGWRAVAVLLVICVQFKRFAQDSALLTGVLGKCGFIGVQVFFVISGFLITTLLLRER